MKTNFKDRLTKLFESFSSYEDDSYSDDSYEDDSYIESDPEYELFNLIRTKFNKTEAKYYPLAVYGDVYSIVVKAKENLYLGELTYAKKYGPGYIEFNWKEMYRDNHVAPCMIPKGTEIKILAAQDGDFEKNGEWSNLFIYPENIPFVYSTHFSEDQWHKFKIRYRYSLVEESARRVLDILNKILDESTIL